MNAKRQEKTNPILSLEISTNFSSDHEQIDEGTDSRYTEFTLRSVFVLPTGIVWRNTISGVSPLLLTMTLARCSQDTVPTKAVRRMMTLYLLMCWYDKDTSDNSKNYFMVKMTAPFVR